MSAKPTGRKQVAATEAKPLDHWEALASPGGLANTPSFDVRMGGLGPCSRQESRQVEKQSGMWGGSCSHLEGRGQCQQGRGVHCPESLQDLLVRHHEVIPHHCTLVQLGLEDCLFRGLQAPQAMYMKLCSRKRDRI